MSKFDEEEQEILDAFNADELFRAPDVEARKMRHQQYAEAMFKKDARINIRLSSRDLRGLQKKALSEGIPYQTLVASIIHKYVEGRLHEDRN
jgi:predicted DNA binding CopG/RHH family protein